MTQTPSPKRILAVDFGERRTGLAATDPTGTIETPLEPLVGLDDASLARAINAIATERETEIIVVGLPLSLDDGEGAQARRTRKFVTALEQVVSCPVTVIDESLTTDEAHSRMKELGIKAARRRRVADSVAALIILERFRHEYRHR